MRTACSNVPDVGNPSTHPQTRYFPDHRPRPPSLFSHESQPVGEIPLFAMNTCSEVSSCITSNCARCCGVGCFKVQHSRSYCSLPTSKFSPQRDVEPSNQLPISKRLQSLRGRRIWWSAYQPHRPLSQQHNFTPRPPNASCRTSDLTNKGQILSGTVGQVAMSFGAPWMEFAHNIVLPCIIVVCCEGPFDQLDGGHGFVG